MKYLIIIIVLLLLSAVIYADPVPEKVRPKVLALFPIESGDITRRGERYLFLNIAALVQRMGNFTIVETAVVSKILQEQELSMSGLTANGFDVTGLQGALNADYGAYFIFSSTRNVFCIVNLHTGAHELEIPLVFRVMEGNQYIGNMASSTTVETGIDPEWLYANIKIPLKQWLKSNGQMYTYICDMEGKFIYVRFGRIQGVTKRHKFYLERSRWPKSKFVVKRISDDVSVLKYKKGPKPQIGDVLVQRER